MTVVLIGFMGSGKSTISKMLAAKLGVPVIDTDEMIKNRNNCSIESIFANRGEAAFRDMEYELLNELANTHPQNFVLATGGGIIENPKCREILKKMGNVFFLDVSFDEAWERIKNSDRPLAKDIDKCRALYEHRIPLYKEAANLSIECQLYSPFEITKNIIKSVSR